MLQNEVLTAIGTDFSILVSRALLDKEVCFFGADSYGKYGSSMFFQRDTISKIIVDVYDTADDDPYANVTLFFKNYRDECGVVDTDTNLSKSICERLADESIILKTLNFVRQPNAEAGTTTFMVENIMRYI